MDDVIVIGGSFAGLTAAMQLGRARRAVTVLDTALPRNRFASHAHGVLGFDGTPPGDILARGRQQVEAYDTVRLVGARAIHAEKIDNGFRVDIEHGDPLQAQRLILAYGVTDIMPDIGGMAECWGKTVLHCPYCHGYEVGDQRLGLLYSTPLSLHATSLLLDWSDRLTLFANGNDIAEMEKQKLAKRGVTLVEAKIDRIDHADGQLSAVALEGGERVGLDALFAHPRNVPSADIHQALGIEMSEGPVGDYIKVGSKQETSCEGVFAAGDLSTPMYSVNQAFGHGQMAGAACHQSLLG